jgi:hypothetical protein
MNLLTRFRKITILRFVLAGLILLFSVPALFADGIASRYPNDVGIENDPDVILFDGFESYTSPSQLRPKWNQAGPQANLRIATEPGNYVGGHKSLEMKLPISQTETTNSVLKRLNPEETVLYIRAYEKFDPGFSVTTSGHNGLRIGGHYPGPGRPLRLTGRDFSFLLYRTIRPELAEVERCNLATRRYILIGPFNVLITVITGTRTVGLVLVAGVCGCFIRTDTLISRPYRTGNRSEAFGIATSSWLKPTRSAGMTEKWLIAI